MATDADWDAIKTEYITTRISQRALATKYGVPYNTIADRSRKNDWVGQRERYKSKVNAKTLAKAENKASTYRSRIYDLADKMAGQLEALISAGNIVEMGLKPKDVTGAIKDIADILSVKSDKDMREQEARIAKLEAEAKLQSADDSALERLDAILAEVKDNAVQSEAE